MKGISAVVFDFGGVMSSMTMPDRVRPIVGQLGIPWQSLADGFAKYRRLMDGDFMTIGEMYEKIWADAGIMIDAATQRRIIEEDTSSFLYRNERTLAWMRYLKSRGLKIGILTNMCTDFARRFREAFPDFIATADAMVISGEEKLYKPMREIYDCCRERLGVPAGEICFIDDVEENCQGARDAGWQAIRFIDNEQAETELEKMIW